VLQVENEMLSERAEESTLTSLVAESIRSNNNIDSLINSILEKISILKNVPYCACCSIVQDEIKQLQVYASFTEGDYSGKKVTVSKEFLNKLRGDSIIFPDDIDLEKDLKIDCLDCSFIPRSAIALPFMSTAIPHGFFFFLSEDETGANLEYVSILLKNIINMVCEKLEKISLIEQLQTMNAELDRRVTERTRSLAEANRNLQQEIEERVKAESQLQHSQKMDAVGQLAGGIAHDLNNMLGGILGAAEVLKLTNTALSSEDLECIDLISQSVSQAADLTNKLMTFSRKSQMAFNSIDITEIVDDVITILTRTLDKKIKISTDLIAEHTILSGDNSSLQNILMNLCINASHAMPNGGDICITIQNIDLDKDFCKKSGYDIEPGRFISMEVSDTGCGISSDQLPRIFEPFYTTREKGKGTGLGLSTVYGTVIRHRGFISVTSEEGVGTTFQVFLPVSDKPVIEKDPGKELVYGSGTILFVDDEYRIRFIAGKIMNKLGYTVLFAGNGQEAVEVFRDRYQEIDLVMLDMIMPVMDGHDAFTRIKEIDPDCPVVMVTGFTNSDVIEKLKDAGLAGFLAKPFKDFELSSLIADCLG
jgi:signal transduction histidine kinase/CheY-like chemotaxis protein